MTDINNMYKRLIFVIIFFVNNLNLIGLLEFYTGKVDVNTGTSVSKIKTLNKIEGKSIDIKTHDQSVIKLDLDKLGGLISELKFKLCREYPISKEISNRILMTGILFGEIEIAPNFYFFVTSPYRSYIVLSIKEIDTTIVSENELYAFITNLVAHEFGHIYYCDEKTKENTKASLIRNFQRNPDNLERCLRRALENEGLNYIPPDNNEILEVVPEQYKENPKFWYDVNLFENLLFRRNERRADLFAAKLVGSDNYADSLRKAYTLMEKDNANYSNIEGSIFDCHDSQEERDWMLRLNEHKYFSLDLTSGKIKLLLDAENGQIKLCQKKNSILNLATLKRLIETIETNY